ncbi:MAG: histidine phosphatase family protein [Rubrivivax sp.]
MTELIVVRHGETDWNRQLRFQGHIDVPLNAAGHEQARRMANALADEPVDAIVCSDLLRTRQTAAPLENVLSLRASLHSTWREQSFGIFEGLDMAGIQAQHPRLWAQWLRHDADFALPEGECAGRFCGRVLTALGDVARQHPGQRVVVVTHGGVLDMLWRTAHAVPLHGARSCDIPNAGINRLHYRDNTLHIVRWADAVHLQGLPEQPSTAAPLMA